MKATIEKAALLECMKGISAAFTTESHPVYLCAENGKVTFQTVIFDKEIYHRDSQKNKIYHILGRVYDEVPAIVEEDGEYFFNGKIFSEIVGKAYTDEITVETSVSKSVETLKIKIGTSEYEMPTGTKFPIQTPDTESSVEYSVDGTEFKNVIKNASKVCAQKVEFDDKLFSKMLHFFISEKTLTVQSIQRHKATSLKCTINNNPTNMRTEFTEYAVCFKPLFANISKDGVVKFSVNSRQNQCFTIRSLVVEMNQPDVEFPKVDNIIPKTFSTATVETKEFIQAFRQVAIFAENIYKAVSLKFVDGGIELMTYSDDDGSVANINVLAEIHKESEIVVNKEFLQHLETFTSENIQIHVQEGKIGIFGGENVFVQTASLRYGKPITTEIFREMQKDAAKKWNLNQNPTFETNHKSAA